jgi:hypothetical protein
VGEISPSFAGKFKRSKRRGVSTITLDAEASSDLNFS